MLITESFILSIRHRVKKESLSTDCRLIVEHDVKDLSKNDTFGILPDFMWFNCQCRGLTSSVTNIYECKRQSQSDESNN